MNNFLTHNITHLSASSINMYAEDAAAYVAKYLLGAKFPFSPAARAGVLAEDAIVNVLARGWTVEAAIGEAENEFCKANIFNYDDKVQKRADMIAPIVETAVKELAQYGEPEFEEDGTQKKILVNADMGDYKMPILGFLDLYFPKHGLVVDIKTTSRMPAEMSDSHKRQQAIYKMANVNYDVKFFYLTGKKSQMFACDDDWKETLKNTKTIISRMNALLALPVETIKAVVPVHPSFYWTDAVDIREELYGC